VGIITGNDRRGKPLDRIAGFTELTGFNLVNPVNPVSLSKGFAQKVVIHVLLCATSVSSVSLWLTIA
jgi:hypothetical protein